MENKNVFDETVTTLIEDARKLQTKLSKLQEGNNFSEALSCMRLLKDTLSLIKEYDWELKYSEYTTDGHKEVSIWEQNHCGDIRNVKKYRIADMQFDNVWIKKFESCISDNESYICTYADECRCSGKSYAIASMCDKYDGIFVCETSFGKSGVQNNCKEFGFKVPICTYKEAVNLRQFRDKIIFIDERSGLTDEQIENLKEKHLVIGFK